MHALLSSLHEWNIACIKNNDNDNNKTTVFISSCKFGTETRKSTLFYSTAVIQWFRHCSNGWRLVCGKKTDGPASRISMKMHSAAVNRKRREKPTWRRTTDDRQISTWTMTYDVVVQYDAISTEYGGKEHQTNENCHNSGCMLWITAVIHRFGKGWWICTIDVVISILYLYLWYEPRDSACCQKDQPKNKSIMCVNVLQTTLIVTLLKRTAARELNMRKLKRYRLDGSKP